MLIKRSKFFVFQITAIYYKLEYIYQYNLSIKGISYLVSKMKIRNVIRKDALERINLSLDLNT